MEKIIENNDREWIIDYLEYNSFCHQLKQITNNLNTKEDNSFYVLDFLDRFSSFLEKEDKVLNVNDHNDIIANNILNKTNVDLLISKKDKDLYKQLELLVKNPVNTNIINNIITINYKYSIFSDLLRYYDLTNEKLNFSQIINSGDLLLIINVLNGIQKNKDERSYNLLLEIETLLKEEEFLDLDNDIFSLVTSSKLLYSDENIKTVDFENMKFTGSLDPIILNIEADIKSNANMVANLFTDAFSSIEHITNEEERSIRYNNLLDTLKSLQYVGGINDLALNLIYRNSLIRVGYDGNNQLSKDLLSFIPLHEYLFKYDDKLIPYYEYFYYFNDFEMMVSFHNSLLKNGIDDEEFLIFVDCLSEEKSNYIIKLLNNEKNEKKLTKEK